MSALFVGSLLRTDEAPAGLGTQLLAERPLFSDVRRGIELQETGVRLPDNHVRCGEHMLIPNVNPAFTPSLVVSVVPIVRLT